MGVVEDFEWYADWAGEKADAPLYARLAQGVAEDTDLLELARDRQPGQPAPQLLLGAVHDRLLVGLGHRLQNWYPTCVGEPVSPTEEDPMPAFREFCLTHDDEIQQIVSNRRVSTNAVGRSAILYPAFTRIAVQEGDPLTILELGASAGLNLLWDRYRYIYDGRVCGRGDSLVTIESRVQEGEPPLPADTPMVDYRRGIDLHPPGLTDLADIRWLRALVVPEHLDRFHRLSSAISAAREEPPVVEKGEAVARLLALLDQLPDAGTACVFSSHVRYQMEDGDIRALDERLRQWSQEQNRRIHSLYTDNQANCPGNGYRHAVFDDGDQVRNELVGAYESYGRWIEWYDDT